MPVVETGSTAVPTVPLPLGVGILGCADIALGRFLPVLARSEKARLVAIASRDADRALEVAGRFGCHATGYRELLRSDRVDLVYIPLANHLHEEWVIEALNHGKHVLCEKPLGLSPDSVNRMLDAADRNGVLLYENLMYLRHPQHAMIKAMLEAGRIGAVTGLSCEFTFPGPAPGNFRLDPRQGGGAFHDLNRYPLSAAGYFLKGALSEIVSCETAWQGELLSSMDAQARTTDGERFTFSIAFDRPYRCCYEIFGATGSLRLERAFTSPADLECRLDIRADGGCETILMPARDHFLLTLDHVAGLIKRGGDFSGEHQRWRELAVSADRFLRHATLQRGHHE